MSSYSNLSSSLGVKLEAYAPSLGLSNLNREKRETQFPEKLWPDNRSIVKESTEIEKPNEKLVQNNYTYRLRVPIILTKNINSSSTVKVESPCSIQNTHAFRRLQSVIHQNLVYLIEGFQSGGKFYIVYEYHHLAISLSYAATNVRFSEVDIATISNIGECLIKRRSRDSIKEDIEAIGSIVTLLSDRPTHIGDPKQGLGIPSLSKLAQSFIEKANTSSSVEDLLKIERKSFFIWQT
ncbi:hypothetical protein PCH_Pc12g04090 [Penicillium rubens Wisconsin 54-1255]|uniref:Uncharacterized protein n=1 Tax=Penicillium rubens (strain ATCC 28089 / DSM 1075 / NRRL 1951 / Wisconsin 54-1255) TaxID=500485 RepID=B6GXB4_PENRW|nr:hypothetical protein PCH_Pc12g04090 [Penicillium rubens Wisconsin 54-1255]